MTIQRWLLHSPYHFRIVQLNGVDGSNLNREPLYTTNLPRTGIPFTVGPAIAGDLNDDGQVTVGDALLALRGVTGSLSLTDAQTFAADLLPREGANGHAVGDGAVTIGDAVYLLRRAIGLIPDTDWP